MAYGAHSLCEHHGPNVVFSTQMCTPKVGIPILFLSQPPESSKSNHLLSNRHNSNKSVRVSIEMSPKMGNGKQTKQNRAQCSACGSFSGLNLHSTKNFPEFHFQSSKFPSCNLFDPQVLRSLTVQTLSCEVHPPSGSNVMYSLQEFLSSEETKRKKIPIPMIPIPLHLQQKRRK